MSIARHGVTLVEVVALVALCGIGAGVSSVMQPTARAAARQLKDGTQLRGIHQSMVVFAGNNGDKFPLPSLLDTAAQTVDVGQVADPSLGPLADSTRNIFSILVFQGFNPVEQFVSPAEASVDIEVYQDYQFDEPGGAAGDARQALWDPAFRATPEDKGVGAGQADDDAGGVSYAHSLPLGDRRQWMWGITYSTSEAVVGNRGPSYEFHGEGAQGDWSLVQNDEAPGLGYDTSLGTGSATLLIHGARDRWEGNVVMNDNTNYFFDDPAPRSVTFEFRGLRRPGATDGPSLPDHLFARENDDTRTPAADHLANRQTCGVKRPDFRNNYLRSYAGGPGMIEAGGDAEARTFTIDLFLD
jgi:hypothetical protein